MEIVSWMAIMIAVVIALVAAGLITWAIVRHRYVKSFRDKGWQFVNSPTITITHGLNVPPFGLGLGRNVDDQFYGRSATGIPFQAFQYSSSTGSTGDNFVITMPLPHSMPEFHTFPAGNEQVGINATEYPSTSGLRQIGHDPDYVRAVSQALQPALQAIAAVTPPRLTIDHQQLVMPLCPKQADQVQAVVEAMAGAQQALSAAEFGRWQGPKPPAELSFYQHDHWVYRTRDDSMLAQVSHSGGGQNHRAEDVYFTTGSPIWIVALTHKWETTRTVTESDGNGGLRTRTETDHHSEQVHEFLPQFRFGEFTVNAGWFGNKREFESIDFNDRFTVRAPDARFAHDIFHPRMMQWLLQVNPPPIQCGNGRIKVNSARDLTALESTRAFLLDFFAWVPNYVWENLGYVTPPVPLRAENTASEESAASSVTNPTSQPLSQSAT